MFPSFGLIDMTKEIKDVVKALGDLKRELGADLRTVKDSVENCNDTCDGVNKIKKCTKRAANRGSAIVGEKTKNWLPKTTS